MNSIKRILTVARALLREAYFLLLWPTFRVLGAPSVLLERVSPALNAFYIGALLRALNLLMYPFSRHLREIREASRDLETYWRNYDGVDLDLYARALQDPDWFRDKRILDVGCGVARKSVELARGGAAKVLGVDPSARNIQVARRMAGPVPNLEFRCLEAGDLDGRHDEAFDYVIAFTVFEHVLDVERSLRDLRRFLTPGGKAVIVFNHYDDKYGSHLKEFIYYPWPQLLFEEAQLFGFWNRQLARAQARGEMGYFPPHYAHGLDGHNQDCFMNLNKWSVDEFKAVIPEAGFVLEHELYYSSSPLLAWMPFLGKTRLEKILRGSVAYVLSKPR